MFRFNPDRDVLYTLGDVIDRGPKPLDCLRFIIQTKNVHLLRGNHEDDLRALAVFLRDVLPDGGANAIQEKPRFLLKISSFDASFRLIRGVQLPPRPAEGGAVGCNKNRASDTVGSAWLFDGK